MQPTEETTTAVIQAFQTAAVGTGSWTDALAALAALTGSRSGQLIGLGDESAVPFNWVTETSPEHVEEFVQVDGGNPRVNPRVRAGSRSAPLQVLAEADFTDPNERLRPDYADFVRRQDIPWICLASLVREPELLIGLAVLRTERQGHIDDARKRLFGLVAPHAEQAVRTQMALQGQGADLVAGAMEALSMAVFVCDAQGRVRAMSPQAEAVLSSGGHLRLRNGQLAAITDADTRMLRLALRSAAFARLQTGPPTVMVLNDATGVAPLLVEVATLPGDHNAFGLGVAALLIVRNPRNAEGRAARMARALYGLTQAETAVVADLVNGLDPQTIARRSGVSVGTVRTHIRHIFEKAGVRTQGQLISAITGRL